MEKSRSLSAPSTCGGTNAATRGPLIVRPVNHFGANRRETDAEGKIDYQRLAYLKRAASYRD